MQKYKAGIWKCLLINFLIQCKPLHFKLPEATRFMRYGWNSLWIRCFDVIQDVDKKVDLPQNIRNVEHSLSPAQTNDQKQKNNFVFHVFSIFIEPTIRSHRTRTYEMLNKCETFSWNQAVFDSKNVVSLNRIVSLHKNTGEGSPQWAFPANWAI